MKKFCPKCGKDTEKFIDSICHECYMKNRRLLKIEEPLRIEICDCGKVREKNRWITRDSLKSAIDRYLKENIKADTGAKTDIRYDLSQIRHLSKKINIPITINIRKDSFKTQEKTRLQISLVPCPDCLRLKSGYFEATIQVRGKINKNKEIKDYIERRIEELAKKTELSFITSCESVHNGYDLKIGSKKAAKKIAREIKDKYDMNLKESYSIYGLKDGKDVYRTTIAIIDKNS